MSQNKKNPRARRKDALDFLRSTLSSEQKEAVRELCVNLPGLHPVKDELIFRAFAAFDKALRQAPDDVICA